MRFAPQASPQLPAGRGNGLADAVALACMMGGRVTPARVMIQ
jgi:hypothetical protein